MSVEAEVDGQSQSFGFMAKCIPMNPMREKWIVEANIFIKEVLAYTIMLPAFKELQPKLGVPICHVAEEKVRFFAASSSLYHFYISPSILPISSIIEAEHIAIH